MVSGLTMNELSHHPQISRRILKPTGVFLLYTCVLTTLSNYAGGLGCEADCQFMVTHSDVTCAQSAAGVGVL